MIELIVRIVGAGMGPPPTPCSACGAPPPDDCLAPEGCCANEFTDSIIAAAISPVNAFMAFLSLNVMPAVIVAARGGTNSRKSAYAQTYLRVAVRRSPSRHRERARDHSAGLTSIW
jgi:hypothetical protein